MRDAHKSQRAPIGLASRSPNILPLSAGERGQAVVEYVLMLAMALSVVLAISVGFRRSLFRLWQSFAREISAACPGCPPDPTIRIR